MSSQRFSPEFKDEAVRQIVERGYSVAEVSERLDVSSHSLYKRVKDLDKSFGHAGIRQASQSMINRIIPILLVDWFQPFSLQAVFCLRLDRVQRSIPGLRMRSAQMGSDNAFRYGQRPIGGTYFYRPPKH